MKKQIIHSLAIFLAAFHCSSVQPMFQVSKVARCVLAACDKALIAKMEKAGYEYFSTFASGSILGEPAHEGIKIKDGMQYEIIQENSRSESRAEIRYKNVNYACVQNKLDLSFLGSASKSLSDTHVGTLEDGRVQMVEQCFDGAQKLFEQFDEFRLKSEAELKLQPLPKRLNVIEWLDTYMQSKGFEGYERPARGNSSCRMFDYRATKGEHHITISVTKKSQKISHIWIQLCVDSTKTANISVNAPERKLCLETLLVINSNNLECIDLALKFAKTLKETMDALNKQKTGNPLV